MSAVDLKVPIDDGSFPQGDSHIIRNLQHQNEQIITLLNLIRQDLWNIAADVASLKEKQI